MIGNTYGCEGHAKSNMCNDGNASVTKVDGRTHVADICEQMLNMARCQCQKLRDVDNAVIYSYVWVHCGRSRSKKTSTKDEGTVMADILSSTVLRSASHQTIAVLNKMQRTALQRFALTCGKERAMGCYTYLIFLSVVVPSASPRKTHRMIAKMPRHTPRNGRGQHHTTTWQNVNIMAIVACSFTLGNASPESAGQGASRPNRKSHNGRQPSLTLKIKRLSAGMRAFTSSTYRS